MSNEESSYLWIGNAGSKKLGGLHRVDLCGGFVTTLRKYANAFIPYDGDLRWSVRTSDHDGWLLCDGRSLSITEYPSLYAVVGTQFGGDEEEGTFMLPNPQDKVPGVAGDSHNIGDSMGEETHTLTEAEMPSHTHTGTTASAGSHNHGGSTGSGGSASESETVMDGIGANVAGSDSHTHSISTDGDHTHTFTTNSTGSSNAHNNMQPTLFVGNLFIFTKDPMNYTEWQIDTLEHVV